MPARLVSDNGEHVVIRPLVYVTEAEARAYAKDEALPIIGCCCPACGDLSLQRQRVKRLIAQLEVEHPDVKNSMIRALGNVASRHLLDRRLQPLAGTARCCACQWSGAVGVETIASSFQFGRLPAATLETRDETRVSDRDSLVACASSAYAQQRPLVTEDPETIGAGLVLLEGGIDEQREVFFPASGLQGNLLRLPTLGVSFGISSIAELQIDGGLYNRLSITSRRDAPLSNQLNFTGDRTHAVEDIVVATKIRLLAETPARPAFGVRLATKLPNASNESGLGLDTTDFYASALLGKTVQSIRFVGNVGLGILGDPVRGDRQNDVLTYGLSIARAVRQGLEVVGEVNGRLDTRGGQRRSEPRAEAPCESVAALRGRRCAPTPD